MFLQYKELSCHQTTLHLYFVFNQVKASLNFHRKAYKLHIILSIYYTSNYDHSHDEWARLFQYICANSFEDMRDLRDPRSYINSFIGWCQNLLGIYTGDDVFAACDICSGMY